MSNEIFAEMVKRIIEEQEAIIGPVAIEQAKQVKGLDIDWDKKEISISGNPSKVIDDLIEKYKELFGQISVEVSKEAVSSLVGHLPADGLPETLK